MAVGLGAEVTVLDRNINVLRGLVRQFGTRIHTVFSSGDALVRHTQEADLVVGAVLIPGASAPKLVTADMIREMKAGAAVVDVAIDQGGCFETSHPTTHDEPVYTVDDVVHYCVANMPGAVPRTSTFALTNATLPFVIDLADKGTARACKENRHLMNGLNVHKGMVTYEPVAAGFNLEYVPAAQALEG